MKRSNSSISLGVRKGAWTVEEDHLLRLCIEKHGEGKWHLIPIRAGLNRCRKSCRLRWLNYLRPDIKRGQFEEDEEDLIIRLHKLLGNRWSLIAGRIPGRTANDVKNYWNSHLQKKIATLREEADEKLKNVTKTTIIKPHPRTFSRSTTIVPCVDQANTYENFVENIHLEQSEKIPSQLVLPPNDDLTMEWWASLCAQEENNTEIGPLSFDNMCDEMILTNEDEAFDVNGFWNEIQDGIVSNDEIAHANDFSKDDCQDEWNAELCVDIDMWDV